MFKKSYLLILILSFILTVVLGKIYLTATNSLSQNGNWTSTKSKLLYLNGASQFFNETQALQNSQLNFGAWHPPHEIILSDKIDYNQIKFNFLVENEAYLIIHLNVETDIKKSIKISSNQADSFCLKIEESGKYLEKKPIQNSKVEPNEWHQIKIILLEDGARVVIDETEYFCQLSLSTQSKIGFRSSYFPVHVDDIILQKDEKIVFEDDFSNNKKLFLFTLATIPLSLIQIGMIYFLAKILNRDKLNKRLSFIFILLNFTLIVSSVIIYLYLNFHFVGNYPDLKSFISNLEVKEENFVNSELERISHFVMSNNDFHSQPKIMFMGSSQTWGAGASSSNKAFPSLVEDKINHQLVASPSAFPFLIRPPMVLNGQRVQVINAGVAGADSEELLHEYRKQWLKLQPKLVFINLGFNDFRHGFSEDDFRSNLRELIEMNETNEIVTILMVEAQLDRENAYKKVLLELAETYDLVVIDVDQYLEDVMKKDPAGLIWWDEVHFTDYGHQLVADYILHSIKN